MSLSYTGILAIYRSSAKLAYGSTSDASGVIPDMSGSFLLACMTAWRRFYFDFSNENLTSKSEYEIGAIRNAFLRWENAASSAYNATLPDDSKLVVNPQELWLRMSQLAYSLNNAPPPYSYSASDIAAEVGADLSDAAKLFMNNIVAPAVGFGKNLLLVTAAVGAFLIFSR